MPALLTPAEFKSKATTTHGNLYSYDESVYINGKTKLTIKCTACGDSFAQTPNAHMRGAGCPKCATRRNQANLTDGRTTFVEKASAVHGELYGYDLVDYTLSGAPVTIVCKEHGEFQQRPNAHLRGAGCPECWENRRANPRFTTSEFITRAASVHAGRYTYEKSVYLGMHVAVEVTCQKHGSFFPSPTNHLHGSGCPSCGVRASQHEGTIATLIESFGCRVTKHYRPKWMDGQELDVFVPEHNLAIEYCGYHVHNSTKNRLGGKPKHEMYHYNKWLKCRENGVTLLTIYDFEWLHSQHKWEAVIKHKLQKADHRVYARKCQIVEVLRDTAKNFCKMHHIEGTGGMWTRAAVCKGLEYQGELVAVMVEDMGDIKRSCTLSGYAIIGGVSKMFKSFPAGTTMMTTNNTGSAGNYGTLLAKKSTRYWWVKGGGNIEALPRYQCQKHKLEKRFGVPVGDMSEREYMEARGYVKCHDSGLSYWVNI